MTITARRPLLATINEAATALAMSDDTIRQMIADGQLPHVRLKGLGKKRPMIRVRWDDIDAIATPTEGS